MNELVAVARVARIEGRLLRALTSGSNAVVVNRHVASMSIEGAGPNSACHMGQVFPDRTA